MPQQRRLSILALLAATMAAGPVAAACSRPDGADLAVGLRTAPPFVMVDPIRGQRGLTFDLWQAIERDLKREGVIAEAAFVACPLGEQLDALAAGTLDLVISPLTITAERLERIDFTHQYLSSGLTVAQRSNSAIDFRYAAGILAETVTHPGVPRAIIAFLLANLLLAAIVAGWLRRGDDYHVLAAEPLPIRLCRYALETVVRTIGLKGIGDGGRSTPARVIEVSMGVVGTVLSAIIFGVLTTALVGSVGGTREVTLRELPGQRVVTLADSTAQAFLEQLGEGPAGDARLEPVSLGAPPSPRGRCVPAEAADPGARCLLVGSWDAAMRLLAGGGADLVLGDWAQLTYLARQPELAGSVSVQAATFRLEPYGWGVSPHRPELRTAIDRALMARVRSTEWRFMVQEYMGTGSISPE